MKPWHDCPKCPACGLHTLSRNPDQILRAYELACVACGTVAPVVEADMVRAERADEEWARELGRQERAESRRRRTASAHERLVELLAMKARGEAT